MCRYSRRRHPVPATSYPAYSSFCQMTESARVHFHFQQKHRKFQWSAILKWYPSGDIRVCVKSGTCSISSICVFTSADKISTQNNVHVTRSVRFRIGSPEASTCTCTCVMELASITGKSTPRLVSPPSSLRNSMHINYHPTLWPSFTISCNLQIGTLSPLGSTKSLSYLGTLPQSSPKRRQAKIS
jgi:hypothetical protein